MTSNHRVLVLGGGVAGLSSAIGLQRAGLEAAVFERAPELREVGAGVIVSVSAMAALERLGRGEAIQAVGAAVDSNIHCSRTGRVLAEVAVGHQARARGLLPPRAVRRADLMAALVDGLANVDTVRLGLTGRGFTRMTTK